MDRWGVVHGKIVLFIHTPLHMHSVGHFGERNCLGFV